MRATPWSERDKQPPPGRLRVGCPDDRRGRQQLLDPRDSAARRLQPDPCAVGDHARLVAGRDPARASAQRGVPQARDAVPVPGRAADCRPVHDAARPDHGTRRVRRLSSAQMRVGFGRQACFGLACPRLRGGEIRGTTRGAHANVVMPARAGFHASQWRASIFQ